MRGSLRTHLRRVVLSRGILHVHDVDASPSDKTQAALVTARVAECTGVVLDTVKGTVTVEGGAGSSRSAAVLVFGREGGEDGGKLMRDWFAWLKEAHGCRLERFYLAQRAKGDDGLRERRDGLIGKGHYADVFRAVDRKTGELFAVKGVAKKVVTSRRRGEVQSVTAVAVAAALVDEQSSVAGAKSKGRRRRKDDAKRGPNGGGGGAPAAEGAPGGGRKMQMRATKAHIRREAAITKAVSHPGIIRTIDQFETTDTLYIVMELAPNGTLARMLDEARTLEEAQARQVITQLLRGVSYLHSRRIVHRDIKPENVLIAADHTLKLTDFGLSRFLPNNTARDDDYCLSSILGTPSFCAPEIARKEQYGLPVDIWGVGIVMHLAITGRYPFRAKSPDEVFEALTNRDRIPFPRSRWACVSPAARDLVRGLLSFDPEARLTAFEALQHPWLAGASVLGEATPSVMEDRKPAEIDARPANLAFAKTASFGVVRSPMPERSAAPSTSPFAPGGAIPTSSSFSPGVTGVGSAARADSVSQRANSVRLFPEPVVRRLGASIPTADTVDSRQTSFASSTGFSGALYSVASSPQLTNVPATRSSMKPAPRQATASPAAASPMSLDKLREHVSQEDDRSSSHSRADDSSPHGGANCGNPDRAPPTVEDRDSDLYENSRQQRRAQSFRKSTAKHRGFRGLNFNALNRRIK